MGVSKNTSLPRRARRIVHLVVPGKGLLDPRLNTRGNDMPMRRRDPLGLHMWVLQMVMTVALPCTDGELVGIDIERGETKPRDHMREAFRGLLYQIFEA